MAQQLGDIKDIEDYKQKIKKQGHLRKKTIDAIKEHFKLEDIELIKTKLIENEIQEEQKFIEIQEPTKEKAKKDKPQETFVQNRKRPF